MLSSLNILEIFILGIRTSRLDWWSECLKPLKLLDIKIQPLLSRTVSADRSEIRKQIRYHSYFRSTSILTCKLVIKDREVSIVLISNSVSLKCRKEDKSVKVQ